MYKSEAAEKSHDSLSFKTWITFKLTELGMWMIGMCVRICEEPPAVCL